MNRQTYAWEKYSGDILDDEEDKIKAQRGIGQQFTNARVSNLNLPNLATGSASQTLVSPDPVSPDPVSPEPTDLDFLAQYLHPPAPQAEAIISRGPDPVSPEPTDLDFLAQYLHPEQPVDVPPPVDVAPPPPDIPRRRPPIVPPPSPKRTVDDRSWLQEYITDPVVDFTGAVSETVGLTGEALSTGSAQAIDVIKGSPTDYGIAAAEAFEFDGLAEWVRDWRGERPVPEPSPEYANWENVDLGSIDDVLQFIAYGVGNTLTSAPVFAGHYAGGALGAVIGGAVGSAVPVAGTTAGALLGRGLGSKIGGLGASYMMGVGDIYRTIRQEAPDMDKGVAGRIAMSMGVAYASAEYLGVFVKMSRAQLAKWRKDAVKKAISEAVKRGVYQTTKKATLGAVKFVGKEGMLEEGGTEVLQGVITDAAVSIAKGENMEGFAKRVRNNASQHFNSFLHGTTGGVTMGGATRAGGALLNKYRDDSGAGEQAPPNPMKVLVDGITGAQSSEELTQMDNIVRAAGQEGHIDAETQRDMLNAIADRMAELTVQTTDTGEGVVDLGSTTGSDIRSRINEASTPEELVSIDRAILDAFNDGLISNEERTEFLKTVENKILSEVAGEGDVIPVDMPEGLAPLEELPVSEPQTEREKAVEESNRVIDEARQRQAEAEARKAEAEAQTAEQQAVGDQPVERFVPPPEMPAVGEQDQAVVDEDTTEAPEVEAVPKVKVGDTVYNEKNEALEVKRLLDNGGVVGENSRGGSEALDEDEFRRGWQSAADLGWQAPTVAPEVEAMPETPTTDQPTEDRGLETLIEPSEAKAVPKVKVDDTVYDGDNEAFTVKAIQPDGTLVVQNPQGLRKRLSEGEYTPEVDDLLDPISEPLTAEEIGDQAEPDQNIDSWAREDVIASKGEEDISESAQATQTGASTYRTYEKVGQLEQFDPDASTLDYGAGETMGTPYLGENAESYEPFPQDNVTPDYTDSKNIPDGSKDQIVSNAVLNVVPRATRDELVADMKRILAPGGKIFINVRDRDGVLRAKSARDASDAFDVHDDGAVFVKQRRGDGENYQKGFLAKEFREYMMEELGEDFEVVGRFGGVSLIIQRKTEAQREDIQARHPQAPSLTPYGSKTKGWDLGKNTGDNYTHRSYNDKMPYADEVRKAEESLPDDFDYAITKYNPKTGDVSFMQTEDFDTATEPHIDGFIKVTPEGETKRTNYKKGSRPVYHHKWQMVEDGYEGFDVQEAKDRSDFWRDEVGKGREAEPDNKDYSHTRYGQEKVWDNLPFNQEQPEGIQEDVLAEDVLAEDVLAEDVLAEDVLAEDVLAEDVLAEDVLRKQVVDVLAEEDIVEEALDTEGQPQYSISSSVSAEAVPGYSTMVLRGVRSSPIETRQEFHDDMTGVLTNPETGKLHILEELGIEHEVDVLTSGYVNSDGVLETNPTSIIKLDKNATKEDAIVAAKLFGLYSHQEAVGGYTPSYELTEAPNAVRIEAGREINESELKTIYGVLESQFGIPSGNLAPFPKKTGLDFVLIDGIEDYPKLLEGLQHLDETSNLNIDITPFRSDTIYETNNWEVNPDGEEYKENWEGYHSPRISARPSDILGRLDDKLLEPIREVHQKWADRGYGQTAGEAGVREDLVPEQVREDISPEMKVKLDESKKATPAEQKKYKIPIKPKRRKGVFEIMDTMFTDFPNMIIDHWDKVQSILRKDRGSIQKPRALLEMIDDPDNWWNNVRAHFRGLKNANVGLEEAKKTRAKWLSGSVSPKEGERLIHHAVLWNLLSKAKTPYVQENMYHFAIAFGIDDFIQEAVDKGSWDESDNERFVEWTKLLKVKNDRFPARMATNELNGFSRLTMKVLNATIDTGDPDYIFHGNTVSQALYRAMTENDPETGKPFTGRKIRRHFHMMMETKGDPMLAGFDNKVLSFLLLSQGFDDIIIFDRQLGNGLWDSENLAKEIGNVNASGDPSPNLYENAGLGSIYDKVRGIAFYEMTENALMELFPVYRKNGIEPSISRIHWELWNHYATQDADHPTLRILGRMLDGEDLKDAMIGLGAQEYKYDKFNVNKPGRERYNHDYYYNFDYKFGTGLLGADPEPIFTYTFDHPETGERMLFTREQKDAVYSDLRDEDTGVIDRSAAYEPATPYDESSTYDIGRHVEILEEHGRIATEEENSILDRTAFQSLDEYEYVVDTAEGERQNLVPLEVKTQPNFKRFFRKSAVADDDGDPLVVYKGTLDDITVFDKAKANIEGYAGGAFYFTDSLDDVNANYVSVDAPDMASKIDLAMDQYGDDPTALSEVAYDYFKKNPPEVDGVTVDIDNLSEDQLDELTELHARDIVGSLVHGGRPNIMPVYLSMQNPFDMRKLELTAELELDVDEYLEEAKDLFQQDREYYADDLTDEQVDMHINEIATELAENMAEGEAGGTLVDLMQNFKDVAEEYSEEHDITAVDETTSELLTVALDYTGSLFSRKVFFELQEAVANVMDADQGKAASSEIVREAIERSGYDGIIMDADKAFGRGRAIQVGVGGRVIVGTPMEGVSGATHYIVFNANQIKSATANVGDFDIENPDIRYDTMGTEQTVEDEHADMPADEQARREKVLVEAGTDVAYDRIAPEEYASRMEANRFQEPPLQESDYVGTEAIIARLNDLVKAGAMEQESADFFEFVASQSPKIADNLMVSFGHDPSGTTGGAYYHIQRIMKLFTQDYRSDWKTPVHEFMHHSERFMSEQDQRYIYRLMMLREAKALQKLTVQAHGGNARAIQALKYFDLVRVYRETGRHSDKVAAGKVLLANMTPEDMSFKKDYYQFLDPSEFWAENGTRLLADQYEAKKSGMRRIRKFLLDMVSKLAEITGRPSDAGFTKILNGVIRGQGEELTAEMLENEALNEDVRRQNEDATRTGRGIPSIAEEIRSGRPLGRRGQQGVRESVSPSSAKAQRDVRDIIQSEDPERNRALKTALELHPEFKPSFIADTDPVVQTEIANTFSSLRAVEDTHRETAQEKRIFADWKTRLEGAGYNLEAEGIKNYKTLVEQAYARLADEADQQYQATLDAGMVYEWDADGSQGYPSSRAMTVDAVMNNHMTVYQGGEPHAIMDADIGEDGVTGTEKFRAVHDYFGHATSGAQFGSKGEQNAWLNHAQMFSPLARIAISTETRGQNSWVSFSGVNKDALGAFTQASKLRVLARKATDEAKVELTKLAEEASALGNELFQFAAQKSIALPYDQLSEGFQDLDVRDPDIRYDIVSPAISAENLKAFLEGSQVQDVVYHGTSYDFTVFDESAKLHWFSSTPELSGMYASSHDPDVDSGPNIMPLYISLKNPLRIGGDVWDEYTRAEVEDLLGVKLDFYIPDPAEAAEWERTKEPVWSYLRANPRLITGLGDAGYDGIIVNEKGIETYAVFWADQAKSATGNRGTYDPSDPDIRYDIVSPAISAKNLKAFLEGSAIQKVVYHGTIGDFSEFKKRASRGGHPSSGLGHYFTESPNVAGMFNRDLENVPPFPNMEALPFAKGANIMPAYLAIKNPKILTAGEFKDYQVNNDVSPDEEFGWLRTSEAWAQLREDFAGEGFDGVKILPDSNQYRGSGNEEFLVNQWVAFGPTQIKSATGNRGTYDPSDPDIRYDIIAGEYWLQDGRASYVDEMVGHGGVVLEQLRSEAFDILDADGLLGEFEYISYLTEEQEKALSEGGMSDMAIGALKGTGPAQDVGIEEMGWVRVKGNFVQTHKLSKSGLRSIANGLREALDSEGQEDVTAETFSIEEASTGKYYTNVPLVVIESGNMGALRGYTQGRFDIKPPVDLKGEYWLQDGRANYADGDVGDFNHEGLVLEQLRSEAFDILDAYELLGEDDTADQWLLLDIHDEALLEGGMSDMAIGALQGMVDARDVGMEEMGWVRVQGNNVQTHKLSKSGLRSIANGLWDALDSEGQEDATAGTFNIEETSTGKYYTDVPMAVIESGNMGALRDYTQGRFDLKPPAINKAERDQLGKQRIGKSGKRQKGDYVSAENYPKVRQHLFDRRKKTYDTMVARLPAEAQARMQELTPDMTAYTPGETLELMKHPKVVSWQEEMKSFVVPEGYDRVAFVPCGAGKLWDGRLYKGTKPSTFMTNQAPSMLYPSYNRIRYEQDHGAVGADGKKTYFVTVSEPLGVVPQGRWSDFPTYDNPGLFKDPPRQSGLITKQWDALEEAHGGIGIKQALPFDDKAYDESIAQLGDVIGQFMNTNLLANSNMEFVSFVETPPKSQDGTHSEMLDYVEENFGKLDNRFLKRHEANAKPEILIREKLGIPEYDGDYTDPNWNLESQDREDIVAFLKDSAVKERQYHATNFGFDVFRGSKAVRGADTEDIGFHVGTVAAAHDRLRDVKGTRGGGIIRPEQNRQQEEEILQEMRLILRESVVLAEHYPSVIDAQTFHRRSALLATFAKLRRSSLSDAQHQRLVELEGRREGYANASWYAQEYGEVGAAVMPLYVNIKNPLRARDAGVWDDAYSVSQATGFDGDTIEEIKAAIQDAGHDGIVYENKTEDKGKDSYIAFTSNQLKSATANIGDYDIASQNIREDLRAFLEDSAVKERQYHATTEDFDVFRGSKRAGTEDIGFHVGTLDAAHERLSDIKGTRGGDIVSSEQGQQQIEEVLRETDRINASVRESAPDMFSEIKSALDSGDEDALTAALNADSGIPSDAQRQRLEELEGRFKFLSDASLSAIQYGEVGSNVMPLYVNIKNPLRARYDAGVWSDADSVREATGFDGDTIEEIKTAIEDAGYDGIVYKNEAEDKGKDSYIAFTSNQLKSATGNIGDYDMASQNILEDIRPRDIRPQGLPSMATGRSTIIGMLNRVEGDSLRGLITADGLYVADPYEWTHHDMEMALNAGRLQVDAGIYLYIKKDRDGNLVSSHFEDSAKPEDIKYLNSFRIKHFSWDEGRDIFADPLVNFPGRFDIQAGELTGWGDPFPQELPSKATGRSTIVDMLNRVKGDSLRGLVTADGLYVANAYDWTHPDMAKALGLEWGKDFLSLYIKKGRNGDLVGTSTNDDVTNEDIKLLNGFGVEYLRWPNTEFEHAEWDRGRFDIQAYHGSPHDIAEDDRFRMGKVGSGEGAQAYGYGLYFADEKQVAEHYKKDLSGSRKMSPESIDAITKIDNLGFDTAGIAMSGVRAERERGNDWTEVWDAEGLSLEEIEAINTEADKPFGFGYTVNLKPESEDFLDWDEPLGEQEKIWDILTQDSDLDNMLASEGYEGGIEDIYGQSGNDFYERLGIALAKDKLGGINVASMPRWERKKLASDYLMKLGIVGNKYRDQLSRKDGVKPIFSDGFDLSGFSDEDVSEMEEYLLDYKPEEKDAFIRSLEKSRRVTEGNILLQRAEQRRQARGQKPTNDLYDKIIEAIQGDMVDTENFASTYNYVVFDEKDIDIEERWDIRAHHGSPHIIPEGEGFRMGKVGTGEGAQVYGHGLYFAGEKEVAEHYKKVLGERRGAYATWKGEERLDDPMLMGVSDSDILVGNEALELLARPDVNAGGNTVEGRIAWLTNNMAWPFGTKPMLDWLEENADDIEFIPASEGRGYTVMLAPEPEDFLSWDVPFSEQSSETQERLTALLTGQQELGSEILFGDPESYESILRWEGSIPPDVAALGQVAMEAGRAYLDQIDQPTDRAYVQRGDSREALYQERERAEKAHSDALDNMQATSGQWVVKPEASGYTIYHALQTKFAEGMEMSPRDPMVAEKVSKFLLDGGIRGNRYLNQQQRRGGKVAVFVDPEMANDPLAQEALDSMTRYLGWHQDLDKVREASQRVINRIENLLKVGKVPVDARFGQADELLPVKPFDDDPDAKDRAARERLVLESKVVELIDNKEVTLGLEDDPQKYNYVIFDEKDIDIEERWDPRPEGEQKPRSFPISMQESGRDATEENYDAVTNKDDLEFAKQRVMRNPQRAYDELLPSEPDQQAEQVITSKDFATALLLMDQYSIDAKLAKEAGDEVEEGTHVDKMLNLGLHISRKLTQAGQFIQSASMVSRLEPGQLNLAMVRRIDRVNEGRRKYHEEAPQVALPTNEEIELVRKLAVDAKKWESLSGEVLRFGRIATKIKDGKPLTKTDIAQVRAFKNRFAKLLPDEPSKGFLSEKAKARARGELTGWKATMAKMSAERAQAARERLKARGIQITAGIPPDVMADYLIIAVDKMISQPLLKGAEFIQQMGEEYTELARGDIKDLWKQAKKELSETERIAKKIYRASKPIMDLIDIIDADQSNLLLVDPEYAVSLANEVSSLKKMTGSAQVEKAMEIQSALDMFEEPTWGDKLATAQVISHLWNTLTLTRNIVGNELFYRMERLRKYPAAAMDFAFSGGGRFGGRSVTFRTANQGGYWEAFFRGSRMAWKGVAPAELETRFSLSKKGLAFKSKYNPLHWMEKSLGVALRGFDFAAYSRQANQTMGEAAELGWMNSDKEDSEDVTVSKPVVMVGNREMIKEEFIDYFLNNLDDATTLAAHEAGKYVTFQSDGIMAKTFSRFKQLANAPSALLPSGKIAGRWGGVGMGDIFFKYAKTPANLIQTAIDYSAAGFLRDAWRLIHISAEAKRIGLSEEKKAKSQDAKGMAKAKRLGWIQAKREFVEGLSRSITGTAGLTALGYLLTSVGLMSGEEDDWDKDTFEGQYGGIGSHRVNVSGIIRYALSGFDKRMAKPRDGDVIYSYDWMQPIAINLAIGASIAESLEQEDLKYDAKSKGALGIGLTALGAGWKTILRQPLLAGVVDLSRLLTERGNTSIHAWEKLVTNIPPQAIPSFVNHLAKMVDPIRRVTADPGMGSRILNKMAYRIPWVSETLPAAYKELGFSEEKKKYLTENTWYNVLFNPGWVSYYGMNQNAARIMGVYEAYGDKGVFPRTDLYSIQFGAKALNEEFYDEIRRLKKHHRSRGRELIDFQKTQYIRLTGEDISQMQKLIGKYTMEKIEKLDLKGYSPERQSKLTADAVNDAYDKAKKWFLENRVKSYLDPKKLPTQERER